MQGQGEDALNDFFKILYEKSEDFEDGEPQAHEEDEDRELWEEIVSVKQYMYTNFEAQERMRKEAQAYIHIYIYT